MATVYLAHDLKHDRPVALKVLRPELAHALGPERFEREIRLAARLQHPHILPVLDSGSAASGLYWFTMPFVEGESLRDRLERETQLPIDEALRIAREAADALDYAHRHGIVHRDIKPENILLSDGHALVADFGIARALTPGGGGRLTETGQALGTAAYMSPEQAAGERDVDGRSDIYSLAIVLYEMLAGETPFHAATAQASIARRFTETPRPLRGLRESVPARVEQTVQRALARTAADRFATAHGFGDGLLPGPGAFAPAPSATPPVASHTGPRMLRAFAMLVIGLLLVAGVLFAWRRMTTAEPTTSKADVASVAHGPVRIAVLPFENLGDAADAYFADGVTDAVRGKLTEISGLEVITRASSAEYRGGVKPPGQVADELGVAYLLTGTVRWAKQVGGTSRVQVSPELVEIGDGRARTRWQQPFDAPLTDVFQVQGDIAARVTQALRLALPAREQTRLAQAPTTSPTAYDAFLRAEAAWDAGGNTSPAPLRRALAYYEQAVALDSTFAAAWAGIARTTLYLYYNATPTPALARRARTAAERTLALEPEGAAAHGALGLYYLYVERDQTRALTELEAAYRRAPGDAMVLASLATLQRALGRWEEALRYAQAAYAIDPRAPARATGLAVTYLWLRRVPEARAMAERALALAPGNVTTIQRRAQIALADGDLADARRVLAAAAADVPAADLAAYMATYWDLGWALDDAGQRLALALGPEAYDGDRGVWGIVRAQLYHWRGDGAQSRVWADTAARVFAVQLRAAPDVPQRHVLRGLALAYLGRRTEALAAAERGLALARAAPDALNDSYLAHQLVRIHLVLGEPDRALDRLEALLRTPYHLTPAWLRIDPDFAPLRGNPRFERLVAGS